MANRIKSKQEKIEELQKQIKEEKLKFENKIGKQFLKTFNLDYEDEKKAIELISYLKDQFDEQNSNLETSSSDQYAKQY
ncbi:MULTISPECIES: hypothetical protein [Halobacillus]|uniref:hypothetical protein n=1 Tax=Halobacillus TaxID=45667 RepID=UPI0009A5E5D8|nr:MULTISPECIES: hypothetical protein [Halobacillus]